MSKKSQQQFDYNQIRQLMSKTWGEKLSNGAEVERFILKQTISNKTKTCGRLNILVDTLDNNLDRNEQVKFFDKALPQMVNVARYIISGPLSTLLDKFRNQQTELQLTRFEIACLLANAFFCTFPDDTNINFIELYSSKFGSGMSNEKIKCIVTYFNIIFGTFDQAFFQQTVTYKRNVMQDVPGWIDSSKPMIPFNVLQKGSIMEAYNMAQVNFANKSIGGGVLQTTCLREEIWFITCPELLVSRFFSKEMGENEAIIVEGILQYANFDGSGNDFTCEGPMADGAFRGPHTVVSMDAINFASGIPATEQYTKANVDRELVKAFAGFSGTSMQVIATGNWGGGCFMGDSVLKANIQMIAASEAGKALYYYAFDNDQLIRKLERDVLAAIKAEPVTVGEAYQNLLRYASQLQRNIKKGVFPTCCF